MAHILILMLFRTQLLTQTNCDGQSKHYSKKLKSERENETLHRNPLHPERFKRSSVKVREIGQQSEETGFMSGRTMAKKDSFIGEKVMTKKVNSDGSIAMRHGYCGPWDGQSKHYSNYA